MRQRGGRARELFPEGLERGKKTDVLTGCPKSPGIDMVAQNHGAGLHRRGRDHGGGGRRALLRAANCGSRLLATAHGTSAADLRRRSVYRPLAESGVFQTLLILRQGQVLPGGEGGAMSYRWFARRWLSRAAADSGFHRFRV